MPKGKKFNAAEKHFIEKENKYHKQISELEDRCGDYIRQIRDLKRHNEMLEVESARIREWVERLLEYTELSKDDIKKACEKDKRTAELVDLFSVFSKCM